MEVRAAMLAGLLVLVASLAGCATTSYLERPPSTTDVTAFVASAGPLVQRGADCVFWLVFKDGVRSEIILRGERCEAGTTWLRVEAALRAQAPPVTGPTSRVPQD